MGKIIKNGITYGGGGGGGSLSELTDVDIVTTPPEDGQVLGYDEAAEKWVPLEVSEPELDDSWVCLGTGITHGSIIYLPSGTTWADYSELYIAGKAFGSSAIRYYHAVIPIPSYPASSGYHMATGDDAHHIECYHVGDTGLSVYLAYFNTGDIYVKKKLSFQVTNITKEKVQDAVDDLYGRVEQDDEWVQLCNWSTVAHASSVTLNDDINNYSELRIYGSGNAYYYSHTVLVDFFKTTTVSNPSTHDSDQSWYPAPMGAYYNTDTSVYVFAQKHTGFTSAQTFCVFGKKKREALYDKMSREEVEECLQDYFDLSTDEWEILDSTSRAPSATPFTLTAFDEDKYSEVVLCIQNNVYTDAAASKARTNFKLSISIFKDGEPNSTNHGTYGGATWNSSLTYATKELIFNASSSGYSLRGVYGRKRHTYALEKLTQEEVTEAVGEYIETVEAEDWELIYSSTEAR